MPKKPSPKTIRETQPLSARPRWDAKGFVCSVCGTPVAAAKLTAYREHDERDRPLLGNAAIVFLCDSPPCKKALDDHPRLYTEDMGRPGAFPRLCGPCTRRDGDQCTDPSTKANGGPGLNVVLSGPGIVFPNAHIRSREGRVSLPVDAVECAGRIDPTVPFDNEDHDEGPGGGG
jgi:hypothetical protein